MTNIYISNARKAAQLSLQGRRELIGFGVSKTRLGICSVYKWQEITLFVLQHNPNFKKKLFICGLPIISWKRPVIEEPIEGRYISSRALDAAADGAKAALNAYHKQNPLHAGMKAAELRQKAFKNTEQAAADAIIAELCREGAIKRAGERYADADFEIHYTKKQTAIRKKLLDYYQSAGIEPATVDEVMATFQMNERNDFKQVLDSVVSGGDIVMLTPQICYSRESYKKACDAAKAHFAGHDTITLAEFRDAMSTSRKYALAVLEYFDKNGITRKDGDFRKLNRGFGE